MIALHNNKLDAIEKEIKNMFELNTSSYLVNYDVFYSKMWSMVKYYLYVLNNDKINNMKQEKVKSLLYEVKDEEIVNAFGEEEETEEKTLTVEEVQSKFDKFMNSFSTLNIYFINIFIAYNKELKSVERGEYLEEQEENIFYENIVPDEQPLVEGGDDEGEGGFDGEELV
jgi:hypothetical protein